MPELTDPADNIRHQFLKGPGKIQGAHEAGCFNLWQNKQRFFGGWSFGKAFNAALWQTSQLFSASLLLPVFLKIT